MILLWFRRDLRLDDHPALDAALAEGDEVVPFFCLDPSILGRPDTGAARVKFLLESLADLSRRIAKAGSRLVLRHGDPLVEIPRLARETGARAVWWTRDYEPHLVERDRRVEELGRKLGFATRSFKGYVLHEAEEARTGSGSFYTVFTPYMRKWRALPKEACVSPRLRPSPAALRADRLPLPSADALKGPVESAPIPGGETEGAKLLKRFLEKAAFAYARQRDFPAVEGTSRLSAHLHFGTVSPRRVFHAAQAAREGAPAAGRASLDVFVNELIWREFFTQIFAAFPFVATACFRPQYDRLAWENRDDLFEAWKAGRTGYPLVDAGMRQLARTGWMHNRLRMIVSMFLAKDLLVSWQKGERWFMEQLVDGDLACNNGGWQWSAGTGTDAAPYFRIFAPVTQSRRFDPTGAFIRRHVPELARLPDDDLHAPWENPAIDLAKLGYPRPVVDHAERRQRCLAMFRKAAK